MSDTWKSVLNHYIRHHNQMEAECSLDAMLSLIKDEQYIRLQRRRLDRMKEAHRQRGVQPLRAEIKGKLLHVSEKHRGIIVYLQLRKRLEYDKGPAVERIENERVTLSQVGGAWTISKLEPDVSEKSLPITDEQLPLTGSYPYGVPALQKSKSIPYLNQQVFSSQQDMLRHVKYMRMRVKQYADRWWNGFNPDFISFDVDCTSFVSQCLYAGGIPMNYTGKRESGWWYHGKQGNHELWSYSWAVSHSLQSYLTSSKSGLRAEEVHAPELLDIGDIISYDWDGDGNFQHTAVVAAVDWYGRPLVNAHTTNSKHRFWDYRDSYAWSERTKYRFFHIPDIL